MDNNIEKIDRKELEEKLINVYGGIELSESDRKF